MMEYNGNKLDEKTLDTLLKVAEELNVPPSYLITKLHYEGLWGDSQVAKANNNLSGMTWTGDPQRPSGVVVEKGSARPANEGGHYMKYKSIEDFMKDWTYLIRRGGIYKVADSTTFDEAVKGMFKYGGAKYDYATMNVQGSQQRYELYLQGMKARRQAINNANGNILDKLDEGSDIGMTTATKVLNVAKGLIGTRQKTAGHQKLVNEYNAIRPNLRRPNGGQYTASLNDDWCDIFITVIFKRAGALNLIDAECGVQHHMNHLKKKGIWQGRVKPRPGDIIIFDWHGYNSGWADHIGIVEKLSGNTVHTIEGNVGSAPRSVARRTHVYNGNTIVGYARPRYTASTSGGGSTSTSSSTTARVRGKSTQTIAAEVLAGVWGNGDARKKALQAHGYNYNSVQAQVNKLFALKGKSNAVLAKHVIDGDFSTNPIRQEALKAIGANASAVQKEVNKLIAQPTSKKSVREVAQEIVDGKGGWGTNPTRAKKLADAGYNAQAVQTEVNEIMKASTPSAPREEIVEAPKNEQTGNTPVNDKLKDNEVILDGVKYIIQKVR